MMELAKQKKSIFGNFKGNIRSYTMIIALIAIWAIFGCMTEGVFFLPRNLSMLARQTSITAILSIGMVFVIISGNIDLSVGSVMGFCGGVAACLQVWGEVDTVWAVIITIAVGAAIGMWHGFWIAYRQVPAFIVTLGGYMIFRGMLLGLTKSVSIAPLQDSFIAIGQGYLPSVAGWGLAIILGAMAVYTTFKGRASKIKYGIEAPTMKVTVLKAAAIVAFVAVFTIVMNQYQGVPIPVVIVLVLAILMTFVAGKTRYGRSIYAIGCNAEAAQLSGIKDKKIIFVMYVVMGMLAALAGIVLTARLNAATANAGMMAEMDAIAACVIGGASLIGGVGSIPGAVIGALVMASLDNGMSLMNTENFWQYIVKGLILIVAVWIDIASKKKEQ